MFRKIGIGHTTACGLVAQAHLTAVRSVVFLLGSSMEE